MSSLLGAAPFVTSIEGTIVIEFDSTARELHEGTSTPTDHPIEDGGLVSDHVIDEPDTIELQGLISNRPILALASQRARSVLGHGIEARAEDAYTAIRRMRKQRQLVQVFTEFRDYKDMIILGERVTRDGTTGRVLDVIVRLREFHTATVKTTKAPAEPVDITDKPEPDLGPQQTVPVTTEVAETSKGLFVQLAEAASRL